MQPIIFILSLQNAAWPYILDSKDLGQWQDGIRACGPKQALF